jgi:hypothetical protein
MHRPGCDPDNMMPEDFLCDFCGACWSRERPMVEGHRGSLICGTCLGVAYTRLWLDLAGEPLSVDATCTMCLVNNGDPVWRAPVRPEAVICKRCAKQSAVMLERDPDSGWTRPTGR